MMAEVYVINPWLPRVERDNGDIWISVTPLFEAMVSRFYAYVSFGNHRCSVPLHMYSVFSVTAGLLPSFIGLHRPYVSVNVWKWRFMAGLTDRWRPYVKGGRRE